MICSTHLKINLFKIFFCVKKRTKKEEKKMKSEIILF